MPDSSAGKIPQAADQVNTRLNTPPGADRPGPASKSPRDVSEMDDGRAQQEAILGAIQIKHGLLDFHELGLKVSDFTGARRYIARAYIELDRRGEPITGQAIEAELRHAQTLERAGGMSYIASMVDKATGTDTLQYDAKRLIELSSALRLATVGHQANTRLADGESHTAVLEFIEQEVQGIRERSTSTGRPVFHSSDRKSHINPSEELIRGVAYRNQVTIIEGAPGSGKSTILADMVATAAQSLRVLVVANEAPEELDARLDAWEGFHGLTTPGLHILAECAGLFSHELTGGLVETAKKLGGFDVVCIDVLSGEFWAAGRDETNQHMGMAFEAAKEIARRLNSAVVVTTHTGWDDEHTRGGSQSYGSTRRVLKVKNIDDLISITIPKENVRRKWRDRRFRIIQVPLEKVNRADVDRAEEYVVLIESSRVLSDMGPLSAKQTEILIALSEPINSGGAKFSELERQLNEHSKFHKSTLSRSTNGLMKRGLVEKGKFDNFNLTETGWQLAGELENPAKSGGNSDPSSSALVPPLNWEIEAHSDRASSLTVPRGSVLVPSQFHHPVPPVVPPSPLPIEGGTTELTELRAEEQEEKPDPIYISEPAEDWADEYDPAALQEEEPF